MLESELLYPEQWQLILLLLLTPPALLSLLLQGLWLWSQRQKSAVRQHAPRSLLLNLLFGTSLSMTVLMWFPTVQGSLGAFDLRSDVLNITLWPFGLVCYGASLLLGMLWLTLASKAAAAN